MIEAATFTLIGGPTVLIEVAGFRLLTDPTFDPPGEYPLPHVTLRKTSAAKTRGPFHLTMDTNDALEVVSAFPLATIVPVHYEGWAHFSEGRGDLENAFQALGVRPRLLVLEPGVATRIPLVG